MSNFLDLIKESTLERVKKIQLEPKVLKNPIDFKALFLNTDPTIIAEIKFASPSRGRIYHGKLTAVEIAHQYLKNGAGALSILTEPQYFQGDIQILADIRVAFPNVPILLKDFVLSEMQIEQALYFGANAILLLASFLTAERLEALYHYTLELGLTPLIEVIDLDELQQVQKLQPQLIAINHRNLKTQVMDMNKSLELIKHVESSLVIAASGIQTGIEMLKMQKLGFNGFLIGGPLMENENPGERLKQILMEVQDAR